MSISPLNSATVKKAAKDSVNGRSLRILWKLPFRTDITTALHAGHNHIEIQITNLWPNRMIGDLQPGAHHHTFAVIQPFQPDSPLFPSGLLGAVRIIAESQ